MGSKSFETDANLEVFVIFYDYTMSITFHSIQN